VLDATYVRESLRRLAASRAKIFGADAHNFRLNPRLAEAELHAFEQKHEIHLPADYRHSVTAIGNGGAGPYYGVLQLGTMDGLGDNIEPWTENDGFVGTLSQPFPLTESWNDLEGKPNDELVEANEPEYERQLDLFEKKYFDPSLMDGAIPICHQGCALRNWLVITGPQAGRI